jgi:hypothetical protein
MCDEKPVCYLCLRKKCNDWCSDKQLIEDYGTLRGCSRLILNKYCSDFSCKHGFLGWWRPDWKKRRDEVRKSVLVKIKAAARKKIKEENEKNPSVEKASKEKTSANY